MSKRSLKFPRGQWVEISEANGLKHPNVFSVPRRPDGSQSNLRSAAYEALMEMVKNSPKDCYTTVQKTTMVILERLQQVSQLIKHGLVQEKRTSIANALELRLSWTNPSIWFMRSALERCISIFSGGKQNFFKTPWSNLGIFLMQSPRANMEFAWTCFSSFAWF